MKITNDKLRVKVQKGLNTITGFLAIYIIYGCLGPYANNEMTLSLALINIAKLIWITLLVYITLTLTNYFLSKQLYKR